MEVEHSSDTVLSFPFQEHKIDALLYHLVTHREHVEQKPVILRLHGILGNLLDETEHFLPGILASAGYSSLTMNTLLANLGLFFGFGIFDDAMAHKHIGKVNVPMLLLRGEHDPLVEGWETEALARIVQEAGRTSVRVKQISGAGHDCMENPEEMLQAIVQMMSVDVGDD